MPMEKRIEFFRLLCGIGFKEIEVAFPAASEGEYGFLRSLIEERHIPEDVTIQVITQTRRDLIERTIDSLRGVKKAIINFYLPTSEVQRRRVFRKSREEMIEIARRGAGFLKRGASRLDGSEIRFLFAPESFSLTEPDFALRICEEVMAVLEPDHNRRIILNLPSSLEVTTPNIFADRVEWFIRNLKNRDSAIISIHTHNDRGTAIASAELALLAGAERVEGTLFGFGERAGNADLIVLALNMLAQGIDPSLDISDIRSIRSFVEECTGCKVNERHPYAGEFAFRTFAGSHQYAIRKAWEDRKEAEEWDIPYLLIDPADIGRGDEEVMGINSLSGHSGVFHLMEKEKDLLPSRDLCTRILKEIKTIAVREGRRITPEIVYAIARELSCDAH